MAHNAASQISELEALLPPDVARNSMRLIQTRWLAGVMMLLTTAVCVHLLALHLPEGPLYLLGVAILGYNAGLLWLSRRAYTPNANVYLPRVRQLVVLQITLDWLAMAVFMHLTGGITSPGITLFFLHVFIVATLLPGHSPYRFGVLAVAVVLLIAILEASGTLSHYTVIPGLPDELHSNLFYIVAQVVFFAVAIFATIYLVVMIMARLRERERQIAALLQTTRTVTSTLDLNDVLDRLARSAARALALPSASIRLLNQTGTQLRMVSAYGLSASYLDKGPVELAQSLLDREVLSGRPIIIPETSTETRLQYPRKVLEEGIRSMLVVPIMGRGNKPLGIMRFYAFTPEHFSKKDADFAMAIARQGATAIENAMAHDALQKADQERAQFVRIVTHELRAPVTGAQSLLRVLLRNLAGELTPQQHDIISRLEGRFDALMMLINDLLAFASGKAVEARQALTRLPVQATLCVTTDRLKAIAEDKGVTLACDIPETPLNVKATEEGLARIFDNLIGNAVKYTPAGGQVQVRVCQQAPNVVITIADTGIGIPAEALAKLGQEFFRAPNAKQSGITGTGLGLAIVNQHIDQFGGILSVESTEGEGTTFTVTLPLA